MTNPVLVSEAYSFAAERHTDQRRKGVKEEPYINHLVEVAALVAAATEGKDHGLIAAAVLHDTLEDTKTTPEELATTFSPTIRDLVQELTDDKRLPKAERKARQVAGAPHLSARAKLIRIADKIANVRDVTHHPPAHWDLARRQGYLDWAEQVVAGCRGVNPRLEAACDHVLREGRAMLRSPLR